MSAATGTKSCLFVFSEDINSADSLYAPACRDAAAAHDAPLRPVADQGSGIAVIPFLPAGFKRHIGNAEPVDDILKIAFTRLVADGAIKGMMPKNLFQIDDPLLVKGIRFCGDFEPLLDRGVAGGHRIRPPLDPDNTHVARADGREPLVVTQDSEYLSRRSGPLP